MPSIMVRPASLKLSTRKLACLLADTETCFSSCSEITMGLLPRNMCRIIDVVPHVDKFL